MASTDTLTSPILNDIMKDPIFSDERPAICAWSNYNRQAARILRSWLGSVVSDSSTASRGSDHKALPTQRTRPLECLNDHPTIRILGRMRDSDWSGGWVIDEKRTIPVVVRLFWETEGSTPSGLRAAAEAQVYILMKDSQGTYLPWSYGFYEFEFNEAQGPDFFKRAIGHGVEFVPMIHLKTYADAYVYSRQIHRFPAIPLIDQIFEGIRLMHKHGIICQSADSGFSAETMVVQYPHAIQVVFTGFESAKVVHGATAREEKIANVTKFIDVMSKAYITVTQIKERNNEKQGAWDDLLDGVKLVDDGFFNTPFKALEIYDR